MLGLLASILLWDLLFHSHVRKLQRTGARGGQLGAQSGPGGGGWGWGPRHGSTLLLAVSNGAARAERQGRHLGEEGAWAWGCHTRGPC